MEDQYARALALASPTVIARLMHVLVEKGVLSVADVQGLLDEADASLAQHRTDVANGARGTVATIRDSFIRTPPASS